MPVTPGQTRDGAGSLRFTFSAPAENLGKQPRGLATPRCETSSIPGNPVVIQRLCGKAGKALYRLHPLRRMRVLSALGTFPAGTPLVSAGFSLAGQQSTCA